jgi:hypothetical protein
LTGSISEAVQLVRQRVLLAAAKQEGSDEGGLTYLHWPVKLAQPVLEASIAEVAMGDILALIPLADAAGLSFFQFGKCIERIAIHEVDHLGSNSDIAKFFILGRECAVRRTKNLRWAEVWVHAWLVRRTMN